MSDESTQQPDNDKFTKMTRREFVFLYKAIQGAGDAKGGTIKFSYALGKTRRSMQSEWDSIEEVEKKRAADRRDEAEKCAKRDEQDQPITTPEDTFDIDPKNRRRFVKFCETQDDVFNNFLKEEVSVELHKCAWDQAPLRDELAVGVVDGLMPMMTGEPPDYREPKKGA